MLQRAAVLIGVKKTGGLPVLRAVKTGIEQMRAWAESQPGMLDLDDVPRVEVLSDEGGAPVTAADVRKAIRKFVDDGTIEQLFVYFAGHGANVRYGEYWLLSGAPDDPNEAVNVEGSIPLARQCGIPHVVLVSDACRTAAASVQSQAVQGTIVFPNTAPSANPGCVDVFYAALVGKPALEVADPNAPEAFDAVYTLGLVQGLGGAAKAETEEDGGQPVRRVRPWPLKRYLSTTIPALLAERKVGLSVTQTPDAIITSEPEAWLSQLGDEAAGEEEVARDGRGAARRGGTRSRGRRTRRAPEPEAAEAGGEEGDVSLRAVSERALRSALGSAGTPAPRRRTTGTRAERGTEGGRGTRSGTRRRGATRGTAAGRGAAADADTEQLFAEVLDRTGTAEGPRHFESMCGFKVHGAALDSVLLPAGAGDVDLLSKPDGLVRLWNVRRPATNTLLVFDDGCGALLPAIRNFIGVLTYEDGELANVTYEPSDNSDLWRAVEQYLPELRELRRVVATATRLGVFRPETMEDREGIVDRFRSVKGLDPTMGLYAAYAMHSLQKRSEIEYVQQCLRDSLELTLFDIAMLASQPGRRPKGKERMETDVFPAVPLLSQGWALLDAYGVELAGSLEKKLTREHLKSSLWTLFDERGVKVLRAAITSREID